MSPQAALHSEVFRLYIFIIIGLLGVAGSVLALLTWGWKKNMGPVWATYRGWLVMAPLALGFIFAGRVATIVFFCMISALGFKEFARAAIRN